MSYLYYWFNSDVCDSKKKVHLLQDKEEDIAVCGVECVPEDIKRLSQMPVIPICKHCLNHLGKTVDDLIPPKKAKKPKTRKQTIDAMKKRMKNYLIDSWSASSPNPSEDIVDSVRNHIKKLKEEGYSASRAEQIARQELSLDGGLDINAISAGVDDAFEPRSYTSSDSVDMDIDLCDSGPTKEDNFELKMENLNKNISQISRVAKGSICTAKILLSETFENWKAEQNSDNDFQHFYQVCQLKRLIRDLNALSL